MLYEFDLHIEKSDFPYPEKRDFGSETTDEELMNAIKQRNQRALEEFIKRYNLLLRSIVGRMIPNGEEVSDVVQEAFIGIWNQAGRFEFSKGRPIGWIIMIARRRAIDRIRKCQAHDRAELRFRESNGCTRFAGDDVQQEAAHSDVTAHFRELLARLPEAQAAIVRLTFYGGLSQREIARREGVPLGTVKTRIELALKKLKVAVSAMERPDDWLANVL